MIINELAVNHQTVLETGYRMMQAARTAPKGKGVDNLTILMIEGDDLSLLATRMDEVAESEGRMFFHRDADNIRRSQAVVLIGTKWSNMGLNCGYCGFASCDEKDKNGNLPCAFPLNDLGIAVGSACSVAADMRVDTRVMFSAGYVALKMGLLGDACKAAYAIPMSATGKSPFFDRVSTRP